MACAGAGAVGLAVASAMTGLPPGLRRRLGAWRPAALLGVAALLPACGLPGPAGAAASAGAALCALWLVAAAAWAPGREMAPPTRVVIYHAVPAPSTAHVRRESGGRWDEVRDPLVLYIPAAQVQEIPGITREGIEILRAHEIAPGLHRMPCENRILQLVDSLRLYPYILSSRHAEAVAAFADALQEAEQRRLRSERASGRGREKEAEPGEDLFSVLPAEHSGASAADEGGGGERQVQVEIPGAGPG